jgi:formate-dependent nitrite reductase membrane component NrfD
MLRSPDWHLLIVWYFFLGGIAGGAYFTAAIADNFGGARDRGVVRIGYVLSLPLIALCGILLILDLGTPSRFMNMLLHFKFKDPMSIGAWMLGVFGAFSFVSSVLSFSTSDGAVRLRRRVSLVGTIAGFFLAAYTGVLLSASALPFWSDARLMGALFLASGASTGMAAISLLLFLAGESGGEGFRKVKRADKFAMMFELLMLAAFLAWLGTAAAPLLTGQLATLFWGGLVGAGLIVPLLLDMIGARVKALSALAAVLVLVGGFLLRYVIVMSHA